MPVGASRPIFVRRCRFGDLSLETNFDAGKKVTQPKKFVYIFRLPLAVRLVHLREKFGRRQENHPTQKVCVRISSAVGSSASKEIISARRLHFQLKKHHYIPTTPKKSETDKEEELYIQGKNLLLIFKTM